MKIQYITNIWRFCAPARRSNTAQQNDARAAGFVHLFSDARAKVSSSGMTEGKQQRAKFLLPCEHSFKLHCCDCGLCAHLNGGRRRRNGLRVQDISGRAQWLRWPQLLLCFAAVAITAVSGNSGKCTVLAVRCSLALRLQISINDRYSRAWLVSDRCQILL